LVIADDVQNEENCGTKEIRAKQWNWLTSSFEKRLESGAGTELVIQTRRAKDDFCGRTREGGSSASAWDYKEYQAIEFDPEHGANWPPSGDDLIDANAPLVPENLRDRAQWEARLLCPEVLSLDALLEEWRDVGARPAFWRTRLNVVQDPEQQWFTRELLVDYGRADAGLRPDGSVRPLLPAWSPVVGIPPDGSVIAEQYEQAGIEITRRVISIDTAATRPRPGTDYDYTALELWGLDGRNNLRILLDLERMRTSSPKRFRDRLKDWVAAYKPHKIVMETNGMAAWVGTDAQDAVGFPIDSFHRGGGIDEDVARLKVLIEAGFLVYPWADARSRSKMQPFEDELEAYGYGTSKDDTLLAAIQAQDYLMPRSSGRAQTMVVPLRPKGSSKPVERDCHTQVADAMKHLSESLGRLRDAATGH
jgi:hypothetical protein